MCFGVLKRTVSSCVLGALKNEFVAIVLSTLSFNIFLLINNKINVYLLITVM